MLTEELGEREKNGDGVNKTDGVLPEEMEGESEVVGDADTEVVSEIDPEGDFDEKPLAVKLWVVEGETE